MQRGDSPTAQFGYDANGRPASQTDTAGTTTYSWRGDDNLSQMVDQVTGTTTPSYDQAGRLTEIAIGANGTKRTFARDDLDRVTTDEIKDTAGTVLAKVTYGYDLNDRLTNKTTSGTADAGSNSYTYDDAGRLTGWTNPTGTTTGYAWDASGNRTTAGTKTYTYDERNRLTSGNGSSYTYTPRGTRATVTTAGTIHQFKFDAYDRMIQDSGETYTYDALDRLDTRSTSSTGVSEKLVYADDQNDPVAITDTAGSTTSAYSRTPGGGLVGARVNGAGYRAVTDNHDDLTTLLSADGTTLAGSTSYNPFGGKTATSGATTPLGYESQYTDPGSGLVNMHARWYEPANGTFNTRDTWTLNPDPSVRANRYTYANADPLNNTDPSGHDPNWWCDVKSHVMSDYVNGGLLLSMT